MVEGTDKRVSRVLILVSKAVLVAACAFSRCSYPHNGNCMLNWRLSSSPALSVGLSRFAPQGSLFHADLTYLQRTKKGVWGLLYYGLDLHRFGVCPTFLIPFCTTHEECDARGAFRCLFEQKPILVGRSVYPGRRHGCCPVRASRSLLPCGIGNEDGSK